MRKQLKKLVLHRETLRRLDSMQLDGVRGGQVATCDAMESGCFSCIDMTTDTCPPATE